MKNLVFSLAAASAILAAGCAHFDVTQTYFDPDAKTAFTNRFRATIFFRKYDLKNLNVAVRTKAGSKLIGASGVDGSVDSNAIQATGKAMGDAAAEALRASLGVPPLPSALPF